MITLCPMTPAHVDNTWHWLQDAELRRAIDCLAAPSLPQNRRYWAALAEDSSRCDWAILDEKTGEHLGNAGLKAIDQLRKKAELWIYLGTRRGQGVGRAALRALLQHGFEVLGLYRIHLRVLEHNQAAIRLYEAAGFQREGRLEADTWQAGEPVASLLYACFAPGARKEQP